MAKNTVTGSAAAASAGQTQSPNGNYVKRDTSTGRFIDQKNGGEPFKGVRSEHY